MKTITIASAKGGSGKSTITAALAVRACQETQSRNDGFEFRPGLTLAMVEHSGTGRAALALNVDNLPRDVKTLATRLRMAFHRHGAG